MKYRSFLESQKFQNLDEEFSEFAETLSAEKSLDEEFNEFLEEGVHDKGIFKAVFLGGGPGCFHEQTEILLKNNIKKKISDVQIGDVLFDGDIVQEKYVYDSTKPMVEVYFDDGYSVICTEDHEFLIDGNWIEAKDLMKLR